MRSLLILMAVGCSSIWAVAAIIRSAMKDTHDHGPYLTMSELLEILDED